MNRSDIESDEDQRELVDNLMERQMYSISKIRSLSRSNSSESKRSISLEKEEKKERVSPVPKERRKSIKRERSNSKSV